MKMGAHNLIIALLIICVINKAIIMCCIVLNKVLIMHCFDAELTVN